MRVFIISLLAIVALLGLLMGCAMLRDKLDAPTRFVGGVLLGCSLLMSWLVTLLLTA